MTQKLATYNIYPQYDSDGTKYEKNDTQKPVWKNVCLNGPSPSNSYDRVVSAVDNDKIHGDLLLLSSWYSSNGFNLIGIEKIGDSFKHQEWWCIPT